MRMGAPGVEHEGAWLRSDLTCRSRFPGGNETERGWMKKTEDQPSSTGVTRVWQTVSPPSPPLWNPLLEEEIRA